MLADLGRRDAALMRWADGARRPCMPLSCTCDGSSGRCLSRSVASRERPRSGR